MHPTFAPTPSNPYNHAHYNHAQGRDTVTGLHGGWRRCWPWVHCPTAKGIGIQITALVAVGVFTVVVTVVLVKLTQFVYPIRVSEEDEFDGLDITAHGERAYDMTS